MSKGKRIPSTGPWVTKAEVELVREAAERGWYQNMSLYLETFTKEFSSYIGREWCLPVSHGTAAVHLALLLLGIKAGDEVICPDITWVASASPVLYTGAKVRFVDIEPDTFCISPTAFEDAITRRTKAVVAVDLFGDMPRWREIKAIARRRGIAVIEDAAEALGATYRGQLAGSFGDYAIFSFNATKLVMSGQGGMIVCPNRRAYERCRSLAHHGIDKTPGARYYWSHELGYNYNWTNIQAALALAQLRRIDELLAGKRRVYEQYQRHLSGIDGIQLYSPRKEVTHTHWLNNVVFSGRYRIHKEKIEQELKKRGIDARPFFYPLSSMPAFKRGCQGERAARKSNTVAYSLSPYALSLPSGATLSKQDVDRVCEGLMDALKTLR